MVDANTLFGDLVADIGALRDLLFPRAPQVDPVVRWLHGLIEFELIEFEFVTSHDAFKDRLQVERWIHSVMLRNTTTDIILRRVNASGAAISETRDQLSNAVTWTPDFTEHVSKILPDVRARELPHHFAFRIRTSLEYFWSQVGAQPSGTADILKLMNSQRESLRHAEFIAHVPQMLSFIGRLIDLVRAALVTRAEARNIRLHDFIARQEQTDQEFLTGGYDAFKMVFDYVFPRVNQCQCILDLHTHPFFKDFSLSDSTRLSFFLPGQDEGMLVNALYEGFNETTGFKAVGFANMASDIRVIADKHKWTVGDANVTSRPFAVLPSDLVTFDEARDVENVLTLFTSSSTRESCLTDEISSYDAMELHLLYGDAMLCTKPLLVEALPPFAYFDDPTSIFMGFMSTLYRVGKSAIVLQESTTRDLRARIEVDDSLGASILRYLGLLCSHLDGVARQQNFPDRLIDAMKSDQSQMTPDQELAKDVLLSLQCTHVRALKVEHIPALCAVAWNGAVVAKCSVPPRTDVSDNIQRSMSQIVSNPALQSHVPKIMLALRYLGLATLCSENMDASTTLDVVLTNLDIATDVIESEDFKALPINKIPIAHYEAILSMASRALRKYETESTGSEQETSSQYVVAHAQIRHFFAHERAEEIPTAHIDPNQHASGDIEHPAEPLRQQSVVQTTNSAPPCWNAIRWNKTVTKLEL